MDVIGLSGLVSAQKVTAAAVRVLEHQIALGIFDAETPYDSLELELVGSAKHAATTRDAAAQAVICLKNDGGQLPIDQNALKTIAVIGPHATSSYDLLGAYANDDNKAVDNHTMLLAAVRRFGAERVSYAPGCGPPACQPHGTSKAFCGDLLCPNRTGFADATAAAKAADVAVVFIGLSGRVYMCSIVALSPLNPRTTTITVVWYGVTMA